MAEYLIQSDTLDAIAEAINQKAGTQNAMTPAQMVTAIGAISGGIPLNGVRVDSGSFTVASSVGGTISVNHGLAKTPFMVIVMVSENDLISANRNIGGIGIACKGSVDQKYYAGARFYSNSDNPAYTHNPNSEPNTSPDSSYVCHFTNTTFDLVSSTNFPPIVGEYQWIAFCFNEEN